MAKTQANTAPISNALPTIDENDLTEVGGFSPYWAPDEEAGTEDNTFVARVVGFDKKDPKFHRVVWQALKGPLHCFTGGGEDQQPVEIAAGDLFTTSYYGTLSNRMGAEYEEDKKGKKIYADTVCTEEQSWIGVPCKVIFKGKKAVKGSDQSFWDISVQVDSSGSKMLADNKRSLTALPVSGESRAMATA